MMTNFPCPPAAIIFDMDGLLFDSERLWKIAETQWLADRGYTYDDAKHEDHIGKAIPEYVVAIANAYGIEEDHESLKDDLMRRILDEVRRDAKTQPGAKEIVTWVQAHHLPYAIASSSELELIDTTVGTQDDWLDAFPVRCSAEEVPNGKPAPDVYLLAAERLGVDPSQSVALEDSPNGARAAVAAGMTCFAVPDATHSSADRFEGITPYVFDSLHDALAALKECHRDG